MARSLDHVATFSPQLLRSSYTPRPTLLRPCVTSAPHSTRPLQTTIINVTGINFGVNSIRVGLFLCVRASCGVMCVCVVECVM